MTRRIPYRPLNLAGFMEETAHMPAELSGILIKLLIMDQQDIFRIRKMTAEDIAEATGASIQTINSYGRHYLIAATNRLCPWIFPEGVSGPHDDTNQSGWRYLRRVVFERDNNTCQYCGTTKGPLECDHVVPLRLGGWSTVDNLVAACVPCNRSKRDDVWEPRLHIDPTLLDDYPPSTTSSGSEPQ